MAAEIIDIQPNGNLVIASQDADSILFKVVNSVTGGNVVFKGGAADAGSLTIAPGGQVAVSAGGRRGTA